MEKRDNILMRKIGNELPFRVPENYFDQFALQIEDQIGYKHIVKRKALKSWMFMAAMFVCVLIMGEVFNTIHKNSLARNADNYETYVLSQVDETSLMDYYEEPSTN